MTTSKNQFFLRNLIAALGLEGEQIASLSLTAFPDSEIFANIAFVVGDETTDGLAEELKSYRVTLQEITAEDDDAPHQVSSMTINGAREVMGLTPIDVESGPDHITFDQVDTANALVEELRFLEAENERLGFEIGQHEEQAKRKRGERAAIGVKYREKRRAVVAAVAGPPVSVMSDY